MASLFINNENPEEFDMVNHIDSNKLNNNASNLEWCNHDYNIKHASACGLLEGKTRGVNNGRAILDDDLVLRIWLSGCSAEEISSKYGLKIKYAKRLLKKYTWRHLIPRFEELEKLKRENV